MRPTTTAITAALLALAGFAAWVGVEYRRDLRAHAERVAGGSRVIDTACGAVEVAEAGDPAGPALLVIHGSGGGFDQGQLLAEALLDDGFRWIAPSRFGYLRSDVPPDGTFDDQADAYAHLLDHLGLGRVAVVALSHGGPSALLFAARHPARITSLTLVSAGVAAIPSADQDEANRKGERLVTVFSYDPLYWAVSRFFRRPLISLMGADAAVLATLTPDERTLVDRVIDEMNPVSPRAAGAAFDNRAAMPNARIAAIQAPTLVLHAHDDGLQLFHHAEFAAATIPDVRLVSFDRGGHLLLAVERTRLRTLAGAHIREHAGAPR